MRQGFNLGDVQALVVDIDGTLLRGSRPLPGLVRFFAFLRSRRMPFVMASNNATKSAAAYQEKLASLDIQVREDQILTAGAATARYLAGELRQEARLYVIGEPALEAVLHQAGFLLLDDAGQPADAVVVGGDSTLTYDKLKYAALLVQRGARFVGTNPDLLCPTEEGLVPEAGATLAALESATGISPVVVGKPARYLFDTAVATMGSQRAETAVLGDRLETDHAQAGAEMARELLAEEPPERVEAVAHAVAAHRFRAGPTPQTAEAKVLHDADKLDAIGAIGVARAFAFGGHEGQRLWAQVPQNYSESQDNRHEHTPVHEYHIKLVKIKGRLLTESARRMAAERHALMVDFFERLEQEVRGLA